MRLNPAWPLLAAFLFIVLLVPAGAKADDGRIVSTSIFEDTGGQMDFAAAKAQAYLPADAIVAKGYSPSAFWVRLDLDPRAAPGNADPAPDGTYILRLRPSFLDEIELFDPTTPAGIRRVTGNLHSGKYDEYRSLNFNFVLGNLHEPRTVWLRIKTTSTTMLAPNLMTQNEVFSADLVQILSYGFYFGIIFFTMAISIYAYRANKDYIIIIFSIKQFTQIAWTVFDFGIVRYFVDALPFDWTIAFTRNYPGAVTIFLSMYFDFLLLRAFGSPRWGQMLQRGLMAIPLVSITCFALGMTQFGLRLGMTGVAASVIISFLVTLGLRRQDDPAVVGTGRPPKLAIIACYALLLLLLVLACLPMLHLAPAVPLSINALSYHGVISAVAVAMLLAARARALGAAAIESHRVLELAQAVAREERTNRLEQAKFLAMLSHELKTPLSAIRMSLALRDQPDPADSRIVEAVKDINDVIRLCVEASQVEDGHVVLSPTRVSLSAQIIRDLGETDADPRLQIAVEGPATIETDLRYLSIILSNLIANALKYSPAGSRVDIAVSPAPHEGRDGLAITIDNLPVGGEQPDPERIFMKYYRGPGAHRKTGSGLGLYIAQQLSHLLDGHLRFVPTPSVIRFVLWLPA